MMNLKEIPESVIVQVVNDGAIGTKLFGEGRLIPVLIIDCGSRPDIIDMIVAHENKIPGDVSVTWCKPRKPRRRLFLHLEFTRPSRLVAALEFDVLRQGNVVDGILHSNGAYLQASQVARSASEGIDKSKILIEVPDTQFKPHWNEMFREELYRGFKKRGLSRKQASIAAENYIVELRELWKIRRHDTVASNKPPN
jgi:hypothetical protein